MEEESEREAMSLPLGMESAIGSTDGYHPNRYEPAEPAGLTMSVRQSVMVVDSYAVLMECIDRGYDYFAAKAMQGQCANDSLNPQTTNAEIAHAAYTLADAALAEREKETR